MIDINFVDMYDDEGGWAFALLPTIVLDNNPAENKKALVLMFLFWEVIITVFTA